MNLMARNPESDLRQQARDRVAAKLSFFLHLAVYVAVNVLLVAVNLLTTPEHLWFYWPMLGWGIGVAFHGVVVFSFVRWRSLVGGMEERELRKLQGDQASGSGG